MKKICRLKDTVNLHATPLFITIINKNILLQTDWKLIMNNIFKNKITGKDINPHQKAKNKFWLKTFINKLSTLDKMLGTIHLYIWTICPSCKTTAETNMHIFICPLRRKLTIAKISNAIIKAITPFSICKKVTEFINATTKSSNLFKIDNYRINTTRVTELSVFSITDTVQFLISKSLVYYIQKKLKKNYQTTKIIISYI